MNEMSPQPSAPTGFGRTTAMVGLVAALVVPSWATLQTAQVPPIEPSPPGVSATTLQWARSAVTKDAVVAAAWEADVAAAHAAEDAARAWHVPVDSYYISSPFGEMRYGGPHIGMDFAGNDGHPVLAARHGVVTQAGWEGGYGFAVTIDHGDGHATKYAHLAAPPIVSVGQQVVGGEQLGTVGNTGDSTGPHLHFELLSFGQPIDPTLVINIPPRSGIEPS